MNWVAAIQLLRWSCSGSIRNYQSRETSNYTRLRRNHSLLCLTSANYPFPFLAKNCQVWCWLFWPKSRHEAPPPKILKPTDSSYYFYFLWPSTVIEESKHCNHIGALPNRWQSLESISFWFGTGGSRLCLWVYCCFPIHAYHLQLQSTSLRPSPPTNS